MSVGLELGKERLLCVPGNHDVLWERAPERYLSTFFAILRIVHLMSADSLREVVKALFFMVSAWNGYREGNIGIGAVSPGTFGCLGKQFAETAAPEDRTVMLFASSSSTTTPADLNRFRRWSLSSLLFDRFTVLEEGPRLLELCRGNIDFIMHGHEHLPVAFPEEKSGCFVVSAGSTSEWQSGRSGRNSFHSIVILGRRANVQQYDWTGARFVANARRKWCFELQRP